MTAPVSLRPGPWRGLLQGLRPSEPSASTLNFLGSFVSNASEPQVADYGLAAGFALVIASAVTPQGQATAAEYQYGTHAVATYNAEIVKSFIQPSVRTPPAIVSASPIRFIQSAQEPVDLTIGSWAISAPFTGQGPVPQTIVVQQANPWQIPAQVWKTQPAPTVVASAVSKLVTTLPQVIDVQQGFVKSPSPANQGRVLPLVWSTPQQYDLTQQATIVPSAATPPVVSYAFRMLYGTPQQIDLTQQGFIVQSAIVPPVVSYAFRYVYSAPQSIDLTQQSLVVGTALTKQGPVPPMVWQPQYDPTPYMEIASITPTAAIPPTAPPNLHKMYLDISTGRLFWQVSKTANPIEIIPL